MKQVKFLSCKMQSSTKPEEEVAQEVEATIEVTVAETAEDLQGELVQSPMKEVATALEMEIEKSPPRDTVKEKDIEKEQPTSSAVTSQVATQQPKAYHFKEGFVLFIGCSSSREKVTCANNASYPIKGVGTLENGLFVLDRYEKQIQACIAKTKTQAMQDAELWHARFGHVGYGSLMTLQRHNMVHDLSLLEMPPRHVCEGCVLGKMHKFAFSQDGSVRATRKLQLVHSDVCGPMRTPSLGNSLYFVTFIDDFSRFCWVYPLKAKSDVFAIFQHYVSMVENETGCKVQTLRTNRGGEYMSGAFKDFLGKKGIKHQCTMPYTPQQNGVAERKNRS
ncbi:hypothetical protein L7F22_026262 [Adiantum nelumboides]|nr:hypothetical protein [Adiantum nelumboides]